MAIKRRISRSANAISSKETTSRGVRETRTARKSNWRMNKTTQGESTAHIIRDKSDPNAASLFKSCSQDKMEKERKTGGKTTRTLVVRQGIIQGFSKMVPLQEQTKSHSAGVKCRLKCSINNEIRKVTSKKDLWHKRLVKAPQDDTKVAEGRRPELRMPACIPKPHKKQRYNIAVVGNEIKLVDPKTKGFRLTSVLNPCASLPILRKVTTLSRNTVKRSKLKRRRGNRRTGGHKKASRNESIEGIDLDLLQSSGDGVGGDGMVMELNRSEMNEIVGISDPAGREGLRNIYRFSDRRTKAEVPSKAIHVCTGEEILLERLDPISNILSTELLDSVKRCQSIIDFVTAPIENPYPPFLMKQLFYDTSVMEELNFPPMKIAEISSNRVPELKLVPSILPEQVRKSLSVPNLSTSTFHLRSLHLPGRKKKKKPKIETILATRPKGFQHAKWLEKTVGADSTLKSKLLQDVIISQVKKCLKRQAELRQKLQGNLDITDQHCFGSTAKETLELK